MTTQDWPRLAAELEQLLRLRAVPFGMKLFETREAMEAVPRIRRPKSVHTLDQVVAQAARLGWTVGVTAEDLVGDQCRSVVGLGGQDDKWRSGQHMVGVWFATPEDAGRHQAAMNLVPKGKYAALAVSPLARGQARPAGHRAVLRHAGGDDLFHQRPAVVGLQALRLERGGRVLVRGLVGPRARRRASRACRSRASPSGATAGCSTTSC